MSTRATRHDAAAGTRYFDSTQHIELLSQRLNACTRLHQRTRTRLKALEELTGSLRDQLARAEYARIKRETFELTEFGLFLF